MVADHLTGHRSRRFNRNSVKIIAAIALIATLAGQTIIRETPKSSSERMMTAHRTRSLMPRASTLGPVVVSQRDEHKVVCAMDMLKSTTNAVKLISIGSRRCRRDIHRRRS